MNATHITVSHSETQTSTFTASAYLATANATAPGIPQNDLTACRINGTEPDNGPFCSPIHGQNLFTGYTYGVTWNPILFPDNATTTVELTYITADQQVAWYSPNVANVRGYVNVYMDKDWLLGASGNDTSLGQNLTFSLISTPAGGQNTSKLGPMISLTVDPKTLPRVLIPKIDSIYGLEIGLPIAIVAVILIILGIWCGMRKHAWSDVRGHSRDYMARRARRRGRLEKDGAIQLDEYDRSGQDAFSDEPYQGGSNNAFQEEIRRQRFEDDNLKRTVSSF